MAYLIMFASSIGLMKLKYKQKYRIRFLTVIALIIPCIMAGIRANEIGSDTAGYPLRMFELACKNGYIEYLNSSFLHGWKQEVVIDMGIGYSTFVFLVTLFFKDFSFLLFFTELFIVLCIYKASVLLLEKNDYWFAFLVFYLLFYNVTLNMERQWMAMSVCLLGFAYYKKNRMKAATICMVIAISVHPTAICALLIFVIHYILGIRKEKSKQIEDQNVKNVIGRNHNKIIFTFIIFFVGIILLRNMQVVRWIIYTLGLGRFANYFEGQVYFSVGRFILELPPIAFLICTWSKNRSSEKVFILGYLLINLLFSQINTMNVLAWRISAYISCFSVLFFPMIVGNYKCPKTKKIAVFYFGIYGIFYWLYYFMYLNSHQTLPYYVRF